jgi:hypothetical protein
VKTEGPKTNEGSRKPPAESNVVRLRDWIGPYEELVPLGPPDGSRPPAPPSGSFEPETSIAESPQPSGTSQLVPPPPPGAADFWGERSAAVHDALSAPDELWAPTPDGGSTGASASRGIPEPVLLRSRRLARACARPLSSVAATRRRALGAAAVTAVILIATALAIAVTSRTPTGAVHRSASAAVIAGSLPPHPSAAAMNAILRMDRAANRKPNRAHGTGHRAHPPAQTNTPSPLPTLASSNERPAQPSNTAEGSAPRTNAATTVTVSTPEYTGTSSSGPPSSPGSSNYSPPSAPAEPHATEPTHAVSSPGSSAAPASPPAATLRSLVTGAGQCSC